VKKKSDKSFFYGICFFAVLILFFLILHFPGANMLPEKQPQKEPMQKLESPENNENEERLETTRCDTDEKEYYLGVYEDQIAVYEREPRGGIILREVLPLRAKDVYYQELQKGVPFSTEEEKNLLLENYTS
jgi:hypothetical protein